MRAVARRAGVYRHEVSVRHHTVASDEPVDGGGGDSAPTPPELLAVSLASCTAATVELYADRKGWEVGAIEVEVSYPGFKKGVPTRFETVVKLPSALTEEQVARIMVIAGKCPVHRTLLGEVEFSERAELV